MRIAFDPVGTIGIPGCSIHVPGVCHIHIDPGIEPHIDAAIIRCPIAHRRIIQKHFQILQLIRAVISNLFRFLRRIRIGMFLEICLCLGFFRIDIDCYRLQLIIAIIRQLPVYCSIRIIFLHAPALRAAISRIRFRSRLNDQTI